MENQTFKYISTFVAGLIIGFIVSNIALPSGNAAPSEKQSEYVESAPIEVILGNADAEMTITEYSDFECPLCKRYFDNNFEEIRTAYVDTGKAKYIFKQFPLSSIHPKAQEAGEAALCAYEQEKFWEMHEMLFEKQREWARSSDYIADFIAYSGELGMDQAAFEECLTSGKHANNVEKDYNEGRQRGVSGTPTVFVNDQKIVGAQPLSEFTKVIDAQLQ